MGLSDEIAKVKQAVSLKAYAQDRLERKGRSYICPACGSGTHAHGTPAFSITGEHWHCFSCGQGGDVLDLAGIIERTDDKREQLRAVASWAGLPIEDAAQGEHRAATAPQNANPAPSAHAPSNGPMCATTVDEERYSAGRRHEAEYIARTREHIGDPAAVAYLESRGWSAEAAKDAGLGYDLARKRLVIPWAGSDYYHIDRAIDANARAKYTKPATEKVGPQPLYNPAALKGDAFVVVEGVFDALAVRRCGLEAVALGSTSDAGHRLRASMLNMGPQVSMALILLDRDEAGRDGSRKLETELTEAGLPCEAVAWPDTIAGKDPDEAMRADARAFTGWIRSEAERALAEASERRRRDYSEALRNLHVLDAGDVAAMLYEGANAAPAAVPTGIGSLDVVLDGGLRQGLYVLGAVSSLGKTTLALQVADNVAAEGRQVLFVTIEQSASELVAKSLSRLTLEIGGGKPFTAATDLEILDPARRSDWRQSQWDALIGACDAYTTEIAPNMHILEGEQQPGVSQIATIAAGMAEHEGEPPAIFIDYLQLLAPQDPRDSDKTTTDHNVMALRQLARKLKTPIIAISSLNRASYSGRISMESFKESGSVEYGADVLLGMQPLGMPDDMEKKGAKAEATKILNETKDSRMRDCELVVLKNRHGRTMTDGIRLVFDSWHASFKGKTKTPRPAI